MPCSYEFDTVRGLMIIRGSGKLTPEELVEARLRGAADPRFDPKLPGLADFRAVTAFERQPRMILEMARNPIVSRNARIAILPPDGEQWGMARLFVACAQLMGRPVEVFDSLAKAEAWLGVKR